MRRTLAVTAVYGSILPAILSVALLTACSGSGRPNYRPMDPFAQPTNVSAGFGSIASVASHNSPEAPRVEVGQWVQLTCTSVPDEHAGTFQMYALFMDGSVLTDATPLVRVDSPKTGWTSRFLVPARGNLRTPEENGEAPRLAMVHYAGGDRNQVTVLRWSGGAYVGASASFSMSTQDAAR